MKKYLLLGLAAILLTTMSANAFGKKQSQDEVEIIRNIKLENYVSNTINGLTNMERPADVVLDQAFFNIVSLLSTKREYLNIKKQFSKISRHEVYDELTQNVLKTKIINKYNEKITNNEIGYIVTITRLSKAEQENLIENLKILAMNGQHYVNLVEQARDREKYVYNVAFKPDNYTEIQDNLSAKIYEVRGKANAALNLANKLNLLIEHSGIIFE